MSDSHFNPLASTTLPLRNNNSGPTLSTLPHPAFNIKSPQITSSSSSSSSIHHNSSTLPFSTAKGSVLAISPANNHPYPNMSRKRTDFQRPPQIIIIPPSPPPDYRENTPNSAAPPSLITPQPNSLATLSLHDVRSPPRTASTKWPLPTPSEIPSPCTPNRKSRFFPIEKSSTTTTTTKTTTSQDIADPTSSFNLAITRISDALNRSRRGIGTTTGDIPVAHDSNVPTRVHVSPAPAPALPSRGRTSAGKRRVASEGGHLHAGTTTQHRSDPYEKKKEERRPYHP